MRYAEERIKGKSPEDAIQIARPKIKVAIDQVPAIDCKSDQSIN
jgi:hypothetical protein